MKWLKINKYFAVLVQLHQISQDLWWMQMQNLASVDGFTFGGSFSSWSANIMSSSKTFWIKHVNQAIIIRVTTLSFSPVSKWLASLTTTGCLQFNSSVYFGCMLLYQEELVHSIFNNYIRHSNIPFWNNNFFTISSNNIFDLLEN